MEKVNRITNLDSFKKITEYSISKVEDNYIWIRTKSNYFGKIYSVIDDTGRVLFDNSVNELFNCVYIGNNIFQYGVYHFYSYYIVQNNEIKLLNGVKDVKVYDNYMKVKYQDYIVLTDNNLQPISNKYDKIYEFVGDIALVSKNGKYGLIDNTGKEIIEPKYDKVLNIEYDLITLKLNNEFIIVDKLGMEIDRFKIDADNIIYFDKDKYLVKNEKRDYIINNKSKKIYKAKKNEELILYPKSDFILVYKEKREYAKAIYKDGTITNTTFNSASNFYGKDAIAKLSDKYALVDKNYNGVTYHDYTYLKHFYANLFKFSIDNKIFGLMDDSGKIIFNNYSNFSYKYGYIIGEKDNCYDIIDSNLSILCSVDKEYSIVNITNGLILLKRLEQSTKNTFFPKFLYKLITIDGIVIIPLVYSKIFLLNNFKVIIDKHLIDLSDEYINLKYEEIKESYISIKEEIIEYERQKIKKLVKNK